MVVDELRNRGPHAPVCQDNLLERRSPEGRVHGRCQCQMQESVIELLDSGQMDEVQHGQGRREEAQGPAQDWIRGSLHIEADRRRGGFGIRVKQGPEQLVDGGLPPSAWHQIQKCADATGSTGTAASHGGS